MATYAGEAPEGDPERRIAERYAMRAPALGRGGMGIVWRARDTLLGREVAIKEVRLPAALADDERARVRARVMREARVAARLNHAGAVTLHDIVDEEGRPFIVMELVEAPTLTALVAERGPLPPAEVAALGLTLLDTLEAAHRAGIVHRDVKPGNVMVRPDGTTKLADFGIASVQDDPGLTTSTGLLAGSPAYMAPEQADSEFGRIGPPTDLWALGATLYFAVEGVPPFDRGSPLATLAAVVYEEPRPASRAGALAPALAGLLTKAPAERLTGPDLRRALRPVAAGRGRSDDAEPASSAGAPPPSATDADTPPLAAGYGAGGRAPAPPAAGPPVVTAQFERVAERPAAGEPVPAAPRTRRSGRRAVLVTVVLALVGVLGWQVVEADRRQAGRGGAAAPPGTTAPATTPPAGAGWQHYKDPGGAYRISYPPDWKVVRGRNSAVVEFHHPTNSRDFIRVQVDQDRHDPYEEWRGNEQEFAGRYQGNQYRLVALNRTRFPQQGRWPAAEWEFTYELDGQPTRVYDLTVTTDTRRYAVLFRGDEADWPGVVQPLINPVVAKLEVQ
ncbi:MAG TPA: serine/threonine-protein kinase [Actinomycetes bacterium]